MVKETWSDIEELGIVEMECYRQDTVRMADEGYMTKFMAAQIRKIEEDKWFEGIRIQSDPGKKFVIEWIMKRALWFRTAWDQSLCKDCCRASSCGHNLRSHCDEFRREIR